jgi:NinB protein
VSPFYELLTSAARRRACAAVMEAPSTSIVMIRVRNRSVEQNKAQWPILDAFSRQLEWPVNGRMVKMEPEEWKDVLSAAFRSQVTRLAMGLDGGVVMLGQRTSEFRHDEFSQWLEFLHATAADRGVNIERETVDA